MIPFFPLSFFSLEETANHRDTLAPQNLMTAPHPSALLTPEVAVVGRHHQQLGVGVLDDVAPVDGVGVAQELVLVDVNSPVQDLCTEKEKKKKRRRMRMRSGNEHTGREV